MRQRGGKWEDFKLLCKVCTQFKEKIKSRKNFSSKWIAGADPVRISNVRDHTRNNQHTHAMSLLKKQRALSAGLVSSSYAPIAQAFAKPSDDERDNYERSLTSRILWEWKSSVHETFVSMRLVTECRLARLM